MIVKENLNPVPQDKLEKAGYEAERKVAYYLKMAFGDDSKLLILHDLRVEFEDGITAQMDHLVIHEHGLIIVESKSVAGKLQVQDDGQWIRWYSQKVGKDSSIGMENPIKQACRQGQTLKKVLLSDARNEITRKAIQDLPVDVLVTFSTTNGGVFIAKNRQLYPEVCPADVVDDHVNNIVSIRTKNAKPQDFRLSENHRTKLAEHLVKIHKPYYATHLMHEKPYTKPTTLEKPPKVEQKNSEYIATEKPKPASVLGVIAEVVSSAFLTTNSNFKHACRKCKSEKLEIRFGKNYYFKCLNCDENNRIDATCPKCKSLFKIRKDKKQFFADCSACKTSALFHLNN
jgi:Zn finger protein HypA/HybF involved in hydrogenase expression